MRPQNTRANRRRLLKSPHSHECLLKPELLPKTDIKFNTLVCSAMPRGACVASGLEWSENLRMWPWCCEERMTRFSSLILIGKVVQHDPLSPMFSLKLDHSLEALLCAEQEKKSALHFQAPEMCIMHIKTAPVTQNRLFLSVTVHFK